MAIDSSPEKTDETHVFIPEEWEEAAYAVAYDSITSPPPICVICGPPKSGKTTFSRHLLNVLINRYRRVAYLDTDVGQPEFTPPGCLSLTVVNKITPDLAIPCLKTPERCFFFGDITPRKDLKTYLTYIHELFDHYLQTIRGEHLKIGVPLVVNTPGWVEGKGLNLLIDMLKHIAPTHVVKVHASPESKNNLPPGSFWLPDADSRQVTLLDINSNRQDSFKKSVDDARLLRDVRLLAYFRKCFPITMSITTIEELDHALAIHPPYDVLMSSITIKQLHSLQDIESFYKSNCTSIVGLADSSLSSQQLPCCVGLGIVKGVDMSTKIMSLITPVPANLLENVDILLHGLIKIPASLKEVGGVEG